jgi:hypothetical protein
VVTGVGAWNSGEYLAEGQLIDCNGVGPETPAAPGGGQPGQGVPEIYVPVPEVQINIENITKLVPPLCYVSLNPVRARLAARVEDWPWSSVRAYINGADDGLVAVRPMLDRIPHFAECYRRLNIRTLGISG